MDLQVFAEMLVVEDLEHIFQALFLVRLAVEV